MITGAGVSSTIVRSPLSLALQFGTAPNQNKPIVFVDGCTGVQLSGLTVDGAGRGNLNYRFQGVAFWNAGGSLANAAVIGITETPFSGNQHGVGVYAYNDTGGPYTLAVNNVLVNGFQKNGLALMGAGLVIDVDNVSVTGAGPTGVTAQNGIQVAYGAAGTLDNCAVTGITYTGPLDRCFGVLLGCRHDHGKQRRRHDLAVERLLPGRQRHPNGTESRRPTGDAFTPTSPAPRATTPGAAWRSLWTPTCPAAETGRNQRRPPTVRSSAPAWLTVGVWAPTPWARSTSPSPIAK
ncbi:MAG: hypothetical protein IPP62_07395 [bacterium]|nr:hypothetical protein [bacterium]